MVSGGNSNMGALLGRSYAQGGGEQAKGKGKAKGVESTNEGGTGGTPPGWAKAPGLRKKGGMPPGLAKKMGSAGGNNPAQTGQANGAANELRPGAGRGSGGGMSLLNLLQMLSSEGGRQGGRLVQPASDQALQSYPGAG